MSNKKPSNLQFTGLTSGDIAKHEDLYMAILPRGGVISKNWLARLYDYNFEELLKAKQLFYKTFK